MSFQSKDSESRLLSPPYSAGNDDQENGLSRMQHLINEMDRSNQRIDQFSMDQYDTAGAAHTDQRQFELLYDEAWKSEESDAASLQEVPVDYPVGHENEDSGCEDAVTSAIAEVSKDFLSGIRASAAANQYGDSDESRISSDTEFKLLTGMPSYARYPETAAGLSDNDWNPYGTESDTNISPRVPSHDGSGPHLSDSTKLSAITSFNPPLHSTDLNVNTPSAIAYSIPGTAGRMSHIQEQSERDTGVTLRPDITADFSTISHVSEQTFSPQKLNRDSARIPDHNKTMRGSELETAQEGNGRDKLTEVPVSREQLLDQADRQMGSSTSSTGYSSGVSGPRGMEGQWRDKERESKQKFSNYVSVMDRAKLLGIPQDILEGNVMKELDPHNISHEEKVDDSRDRMSRKYHSLRADYVSDEDLLGKRVQQVLCDTRHLEENERNRESRSSTALDYNMLQQDLQEIQDSLHRALGPEGKWGMNGGGDRLEVQPKRKTPASSEDDGDIIPSTTTTPERRRNKMAWDFAADLGYQQPGGLMGDISLDTFATNSHRPSDEKKSYNSDGEDTRTSGSSDKMDDHAAADQAMAEMSEILNPLPQDLHSSRDVDQVLSSFRNQRKQIESRYQQLNNQGLAEKVYRILTNQDPESQANGILSEVSAEEREQRAKYALSLHNKDFNFSTTSPSMDESNHSLAHPDDVRKRLDLSGLSSAEGSRLVDKSSLLMPSSNKGFTAFEDMTKFLSSQMAKASERTFNHSVEMRVPPQVIQCYPLFADKQDEEKGDEKADGAAAQGLTGATQTQQLRGASSLLRGASEDETEDRAQQMAADIDRPASTSSPKEFSTVHQDQNNSAPSADDSDSSTGRRREKYRPYRPAGSKEVYYTESDAASVADSVTTVESTHFGSDDARGPNLPSNVLGSRKDPPNVTGIYGNRKPLSTVQEDQVLSSIQEKSASDEREAEPSVSSKSSRNGDNNNRSASKLIGASVNAGERGNNGSRPQTEATRAKTASEEQDEGVSVNVRTEFTAPGADMAPSHSVAAARRNARWANRVNEEQDDYQRRREPAGLQENTRDWTTQRSDLHRREYHYQPWTGDRGDAVDSGLTWNESRRRHDDYTLPTDAFIRTESSQARRAVDSRDSEPMSLRIQMRYDPDRPSQETAQKYKFDKEFENQGRRTQATEDFGHGQYQYRSEADRPYRRGFRDNQQPYSSLGELSYSPPRHHYSAQRDGALPRAHSDENLYSPVREARLSPAFRRALSPELRQAIESRSPLLSRDLERSLAQPPSYYPNRHSRDHERDRDLARSLSPPPTFLARERGQPRREYYESPVSGRRSPRSPVRRERSWSPPVQPRAVSPSRLGNSTEKLDRSASPTSRKTPVSTERDSKARTNAPMKKTSPSPKRYVELTLENMSSETEDTERDREPVSKRAQLLTQALTQDQEPGIRPDINALWEQFKSLNESYDSSMNSSRMESVADLLRNPSRHLVSQYLKDRENYRIERQERAEVEREQRLKEQQHHQKLRHSMQSSSEEELSGSYVDLLAKKEEERIKRRMSKKKKGKPSELSKPASTGQEAKPTENVPDSLFSIPEDASFEQSPTKSPSKSQKPKVPRQPNIIDPNMNKLRNRIDKQRRKIDKNTLKEFRRVEKLKKLEQLLSSKKQGEIGDQTLEKQLDEISSTSTPGSDNSQDGWDKSKSIHNITPPTDDSTTAKDSSAEMHAWKAEKERRIKELKAAEARREKEMISLRSKSSRPGFAAKGVHRGASSRASSKADGEIRLLKLVKEGYLTPEEAYRLAVERVGGNDDLSSLGDSHGSSDELNGSSSGKLHRMYSPYSRGDFMHGYKSRHVPKLKFAPTVDDVPKNRYPVRGQGQNFEVRTAWPAFDGSQGTGYIRPKSADNRFGSPNSREKSPVSQARPFEYSRMNNIRSRAESPNSRQFYESPSPTRRNLAVSPGGRIRTGEEQSFSPSRPRDIARRPHSSSPTRREIRPSHRHTDRHPSYAHGNRKSYRSENEPPSRETTPSSGGIAWQIPMDQHPSMWREPQPQVQRKLPLQERRVTSNNNNNTQPARKLVEPLANDDDDDVGHLQGWKQPENKDPDRGIWHKSDHPQGIPQELWDHIVQHDALATKTNHWEVDPLMDRVQYILNKPSGDNGTDDGRDRELEEALKKPNSKMTLQEAFLTRKQSFISKCRERQKRLALSRENRHMQECLRLEREAIFAEQDRLMPPNLHAHPYSENLYQPKRRVFSKQEMKDLTMKRYKNLPEVVMKKETDKRNAECKLNRLRARIFNKKVQREALRKSYMRRR